MKLNTKPITEDQAKGRELIAAVIMEARSDAHLTQKELADAIGTSQPNISRWESGSSDITLAKLREIAEACGKRLNVYLE